ncbi:hypothetical protein H6P81_014391 [Aristolochia fimbriata]|uniref:Pentatricopeptide repeat (PPR) superfamily protein n=1 Tax=Aristolochia fimbriata TaxID=158543 RepID=A0AAV7ELY9_ARIFI|nr:hypothetical protein H6P81_014391 [Aristolochia fimbriata]
MALSFGSAWISRLSHSSAGFVRVPSTAPSSCSCSCNSNVILFLLLSKCKELSAFKHFPFSPTGKRVRTGASLSDSKNVGKSESSVLDEELLRRVSGANGADEVLDMITEKTERYGGVVECSDCNLIVRAALERNNADLAFSIMSAMRSSLVQDMTEKVSFGERWKWDRPDVNTYASLVLGLAALLRVSDAIKTINDISRMGVSSGEEVPFGKIVKCPTCMIAIAVAQPQNGTQLASCSKCRYQYELVSGEIVTIESEEISMDISAWEKGLRLLQIMKQSIPAALHSIVVRTPSGTARTQKFATQTVELPAQEGERVTIALAAPVNAYREMGPLRFTARSPGFKPGEPMFITNHTTGQESQLLRAPMKNGNLSVLNPSILVPTLALLATGDVASGVVDPSLPRLISVAAIASVALGTTINSIVMPKLNQLPQKLVEVISLKQQLLSQYDLLQNRIKDLRQAAEKEVWMLARMCQLENKIVAVGEPSYRARRSRVQRVRQNLEASLLGRLELIDSYAKISSMIEIEVEMDSDVLAAEAVSNAETISQQIEQIMELENLEERWRIQAEANDEVERLLSSQPLPTEVV